MPVMLALPACAPQTSTWNGTAAAGPNPFAENSPPPSACGADAKPVPLNASTLSDAQLGDQMTQYFRTHCLPLVSARVARDAAGTRHVILYGFVATDFGKNDALRKAQQLLGDNPLALDNNILIRPQIAAMAQQQTGTNGAGQTTTSTSSEAQVPPGVQQYQNQGQAQHSWLSTLAPLLGGITVGGGSFGSGMMLSPGGVGMVPMAPMYPGYPPYPGIAPVYPGAMPFVP